MLGFSHGRTWEEGSVWPAAKRSLTARGCLWARVDQLVCDPAPSNPGVDQLVRNYPVRARCWQQVLRSPHETTIKTCVIRDPQLVGQVCSALTLRLMKKFAVWKLRPGVFAAKLFVFCCSCATTPSNTARWRSG